MKKISILLLIANLSQNTYSNSVRLLGLRLTADPEAERQKHGVHTGYINEATGEIHNNARAHDPHRKGSTAERLKAELAARKLKGKK